MKRFYTLCVVLLVLSSLLLSTYVQANGVGNEPPDSAIWMPDANLRNAVRAALHLNVNEPLTQQQLLNLTVLNAPRLGITDLTGLEYATNLRSLAVGGNQISDLTPLANLTGLRALYIGGNAISNINPLAHLTNLRRLGMLRNQITDIRVLADLVNLTYLRLEGNPITDTSPLESLPSLSDVDIEIPSLIPDANLRTAVRAELGIAPNLRITIDAMRHLTTLNASRLGITDPTGLEYATNLTHLYLRDNLISDIAPLAHLTNLRALSIGRNQITDLTPLSNLTRLTGLYIGDNLISDINPLAHLTNLRRLGMFRNQVTDITVLAGLVNLTYLRLAGNPITNPCPLESLPKLRDVDIEIPNLIPDANLRAAVRTALGMEASACITTEAMQDLTTLNAAQLGIRDLTGLEYATNLTHLYIEDNLISDIAPLAQLTNLRVLSIGGNQITDLTPLSNLTRLTKLSIDDNTVSAISPLANLQSLGRLEARQNSISDISVLAGLVNLAYLRLAGNPIRDLSPLRNLPKLRSVDVQVFSPPQEENIRRRGEPTRIIDPPQGDSGQSPQQPKYARSANVNQPTTTPQPQPHQQPDANRGSQPPQQHQQPNLNSGPQVQNDPPVQNGGPQAQNDPPVQNSGVDPPDENSGPLPPPPGSEITVYTPPQKDRPETMLSTHTDLSDKTIGENVPPALAAKLLEAHESSEPITNGAGFGCDQNVDRPDGNPPFVKVSDDGQTLVPLNNELQNAEFTVTTDCSRGGRAPSQPKNAFILDRVTLEQLDPATLEAQLDTWRAESDGSTLYLRSIALLESVLATRRPDKTHLLPNYPNPFNPETWIPYHLANPSQVQITIYDTRGTVVRHLDLGHQQAGYYTSRSRAVYWDGCNDIGEKVSSGIYFYQLQTEKTSLLRKMLILK